MAPAPEPELTFGTFVVSLASSVVFHLGEAPSPETGKVEVNLPLAKQTLDLLALLQDKTRGNLNEEETRLLQSLIYDLRLRYVQATQARK
jgi:hypothetical protein